MLETKEEGRKLQRSRFISHFWYIILWNYDKAVCHQRSQFMATDAPDTIVVIERMLRYT